MIWILRDIRGSRTFRIPPGKTPGTVDRERIHDTQRDFRDEESRVAVRIVGYLACLAGAQPESKSKSRSYPCSLSMGQAGRGSNLQSRRMGALRHPSLVRTMRRSISSQSPSFGYLHAVDPSSPAHTSVLPDDSPKHAKSSSICSLCCLLGWLVFAHGSSRFLSGSYVHSIFIM